LLKPKEPAALSIQRTLDRSLRRRRLVKGDIREKKKTTSTEKPNRTFEKGEPGTAKKFWLLINRPNGEGLE